MIVSMRLMEGRTVDMAVSLTALTQKFVCLFVSESELNHLGNYLIYLSFKFYGTRLSI